MEKSFNRYFLFFFLFINFEMINCILYRKPLTHPIKIVYEYSNLIRTDDTQYIVELLKEAKKIITRLVLCNNIRKITIDNEVMSKCKGDYKFTLTQKLTADIIIFPIYKYFEKPLKNSVQDNFKVYICTLFDKTRVQPSLAILNINDRIDIDKIKNNENYKYIVLLELLRALTDCLGLTKDFLVNKKQLRNNFFSTPLYLVKNSESFKSIKKLYRLSNITIPETEIDFNGNFYISHWSEDSIVKDFRNEKITLESDMGEVSMNLLNDMNYYKVALCDFQFIFKNKCYRVDQKCVTLKEFDSFYLNYGINTKDDNQIICYLSDGNNLQRNQCGVKYGHLLNEILDFSPVIKKFDIRNPIVRKYEIPELVSYKNQTLNLLVQSKKCKVSTPRTIYFQYGDREGNNNIILNKITFNQAQKKFFVTYLTNEENYFKEYLKILNSNGLIRSYSHSLDHNLLIKSFSFDSVRRKYVKLNELNKYQKVYYFIGNYIFFEKDKLYENYLYMKSYFPSNFTYMPISYIYPKKKEVIEKKFKNYKLNMKNLWIVKPVNLFSGKGIHLFKSLNEEKNNNYIISKYLNPHVINGKKYDLRLYVLITGFNPLRIYLNKEGLVRIASSKYTLNINSVDNKFVHLTNTAINTENADYVYPKNSDDSSANKWNLNTYKKYLKSNKINTTLIFEKIKDIVIKTIISGQRTMINTTNELNLNDRNMFNLFGFDILITDKLEPALLEVNTRPFMLIYDKMDKIIKTNLFVDTLNIVGITPFSHEKRFKSFDKDTYTSKINDIVENAFCELTRPRGDFELIFPLKNNIEKYRKFFFRKATKENKKLWIKVLKDK